MVAILVCSGCVTLPRTRPPKPQAESVEVGNPVRINVNRASEKELETLPGIGKALAERIVAHRQQYGAFRQAEHLMMVRGFSEQKFLALRGRITVE